MKDYDLISLPERFLAADSNAIITTSISLSASFRIEHERLMRYIEKMGLPDDLKSPAFQEYRHEGKGAYKLTRDGMLLTVMQLPGREASLFRLAYINAFNEMAKVQYQKDGGALEKVTDSLNQLNQDELKSVMLACMNRLT